MYYMYANFIMLAIVIVLYIYIPIYVPINISIHKWLTYNASVGYYTRYTINTTIYILYILYLKEEHNNNNKRKEYNRNNPSCYIHSINQFSHLLCIILMWEGLVWKREIKVCTERCPTIFNIEE